MPEQSPPPADFAGLSLGEIARHAAAGTTPPVDRWHPPHCGDSAMRIAADGGWWHEGAPITRPAMVRLFASILRREPDGGYVLVTPVERLSIQVDHLPFVAVELASEGSREQRRLGFRLNTGDMLVADAAHPLRIDGPADDPRPALVVRPGLDARIARSVYYELAELALAEAADPPALWSEGVRFVLSPA